MTTAIVAHALLKLILSTTRGGTYALITRVMIVKNLQSPIYLGQDIFQSKHLFYALTNEHMIMKGKHSLLYTPYVKEEITEPTICNTIQSAPAQLKWFTTRSIILPSQRTTQVRVTHTQNEHLKPESTVEVHPCSQSTLPNGLHMIPTINVMDNEHQTTTIAIRNDSRRQKLLPANCLIGKSIMAHIASLSANPSDITAVTIEQNEIPNQTTTHPDDTSLDQDRQLHQAKLATDSAIINDDPIPDEYNIKPVSYTHLTLPTKA